MKVKNIKKMTIGQYIIGKYFYDGTPGAWGNGKSNGYWEFDTKEKVRDFICSKEIWLYKESDISSKEDHVIKYHSKEDCELIKSGKVELLEEVLNNGGFIGRFVGEDKYGFCEHRYYLFLSLKDWDEWYQKGLFR